MVPSVVTLTNPVPVGIPLMVTVLAALSLARFRPPGIFTSLIPVADPPNWNVIGSIAVPIQTVWPPKGAVV